MMSSINVTHPLEALREQLFPYRPPVLALVQDVLTPAECHAEIARIEASDPSVATINAGGGRMVLNTRVRNNDRVIFEDVPLAARLFERMRSAIPDVREGWNACGLNERFRAYRYARGQRFAPHFDGSFVRNDEEQSLITVIIYLNEGCGGGETAFGDLEYVVTPNAGMALLFEHMVLHEGCEVTSGLKYVLRTDVMYRKPSSAKGPVIINEAVRDVSRVGE